MKFLLRAACGLALFASSARAAAPQVAELYPRGTVKDVRQVTARFSTPMVPIGDPRVAANPFAIDCNEPGKSRWVDSRTWVHDFDRDLPAGVRCTFTLRDGIRSLAKQTLEGERVFSFDTGGPAVRSSVPDSGSESIEEEQAFVVVLDAEATEASVLEHVWFSVAGLPERIGVRLVSAEERKAILATLEEWQVDAPVVVLQARQKFPHSTDVKLVWGKGVATASGLATTQDQQLEFVTRSPFELHLHCERQNELADCVPFLPIVAGFTAPVASAALKQLVLVGADGQRWSPDPPDPSDESDYRSRATFSGPFPERGTLQLELPSDLRDDSGRKLENADPAELTIETADDPPLAKFSSRFGIIEKADPVLPVTLRNLEPDVAAAEERVTRERPAGVVADVRRLIGRVIGNVEKIEKPEDVLPWLRRVAGARRARSVFETPAGGTAAGAVKKFTVPKPNGAKAFEVVGIPLESPGLYVVELASPKLGAALLGKEQPMYVATAALVTNLAVHFKWGRANSLVWVTSLEDARPVSGASVAVQDCSGAILWSGETNEHGFVVLEALPARDGVKSCPVESPPDDDEENRDYYDDFSDASAISPYALSEGVLVTAQIPGDISFAHSSWTDGIEPWRYGFPSESSGGEIQAHTIFDRTLLRAGETVHMKHVLRASTLRGFDFVPPEKRPDVVEIQHLGSNDKFSLPLAWDGAGNAESTWPIPAQAKLGSYDIVLRRSGSEVWRDRWRSGSFRVEEFRVPLMRGAVQLPAEPPVRPQEVPVEISVQYLAGGGARALPVVVRAQVRRRSFSPPPQFDEYTFANGGVKEGVFREGEDEDEGEDADDSRVLERKQVVLDDAGTARTVVSGIPPLDSLRELLAEAEYRDPNGEVQTVSSTVALWPAAWLVGIEAEDWVGSDKQLRTKLAVVDQAGKPVAEAPVRVDVHRRTTFSHRKRVVGGFYSYEHIEEVGPVLGTICQGVTDGRGIFLCDGTAPAEGDLILLAAVHDPRGNEALAHIQVYVQGADRLWFRPEDSDRIDVIPEAAQYKPGDTARLQVRSPFAEATALVTSERDGILDARVVALSGKEPVVQIPVADAYSPNVYVSVLAVRGRISGVPPTAMVDLGKPAFKMGLAELRVGWEPHELVVEVSPDREAYKVREKAAVKVRVRTAGGAVPPGGEIALAAVDEGLLELMPNSSWDLLPRMMGRRGYSVLTATAQMQVVGKRHFGLKARPQGGGGGRGATRELFDTLLLWRGKIALDANGEATTEVPLNDSLTSFRIAAVATAGASMFGDGGASIRSTQDLMILSGLPPLVREGDRFRAEFTLRNTTAKAMTVRVSGVIEEVVDPQTRTPLAPHREELAGQEKILAAGESAILEWDVSVPLVVERLRYGIQADGGVASDRIAVTQRVRPAVPVRTLQATLMRWEKPIEEKVEAPLGALPGRGGIDIDFAPTLAVGLDGVREWMREYPYTCLEQRVSRAVALGDTQMWQDVVASLPAHLDGDGLLKYFARMDTGSEVLTAYVLSISIAAGVSVPTDVQERMVDGLQRFVAGTLARRSPVDAADLSIRKLAAVAALARAGKASREMLDSIPVEPNLWPTSALLDWWTILTRVPGAPARGQEAEQILRSRLNLQGTTLGFSTERGDSLWWLMICPDGNAARLLLQAVDAGIWRDDLPRLMRGLLLRQERGHWDCTVSNAWGTVAVQQFTRAFEATPVSGTSTAAIDGEEKTLTWAVPPEPRSLAFAWPVGIGSLRVDHRGKGNPWVTVQSRAALPLTEPLSSGYRIAKTITPVESRVQGRYSVGDILRVRLEIEAQADMTWVAINDPIAAGASHLGRGLARDSQIATQGEDRGGWNEPAYVERAQEAFRAYYQFVAKGPLVTEYTIRLNQSGRLQVPPTRVEALYAPEMFGELPNADMIIEE